MGVVVRRYIDFLIVLIPTPLVSVLFCSSIPTFCSSSVLFDTPFHSIGLCHKHCSFSIQSVLSYNINISVIDEMCCCLVSNELVLPCIAEDSCGLIIITFFNFFFISYFLFGRRYSS